MIRRPPPTRFRKTDFTLSCPICRHQAVYVTTTYSPLAGELIIAYGNSCGCAYTDAQAKTVQQHARRAYFDVIRLALAEAQGAR